VAGAFVGVVGTEGLLRIDLALLVVAVVTALLVRTPVIGATTTVLRGVAEAWAVLRAERGLLWLQLFIGSSFFFGGTSVALTTPLYLTVTDARTAGLLLGLSGSGMLVGVVMAIFAGIRRRRGQAIVVLEGVAGLALAFVIVSPTPAALTVVSIVFLATTAISAATSQGLWQERIPTGLQVRVFALRRMIAWSGLPLGYTAAGYAADAAADALQDETLGIAVVFAAAGIGKALVSIAFFRAPLAELD
jgi:hypothetical protein